MCYDPFVCLCHTHGEQKDVKLVVAGGGDAADEKVRRNIQMSLAKKLQEKSTRFRSLQKDYMAKLQGQKAGASGASELEFLNEAANPKRKGQVGVR
jgi:hypothetical protein